jgi:hypothetical protein
MESGESVLEVRFRGRSKKLNTNDHVNGYGEKKQLTGPELVFGGHKLFATAPRAAFP